MEHDANGSEHVSILVWDLPVRLFHWLLAAGFVAALLLATLTSDDGPAFPLHMILGLVIGFMVLLRIVWGFVGTRYARFRSFLFGPAETAAYLRSAAPGRATRTYVGHNPGASWAIFAMLVLILGIGVSGWLSAQGNETFEEVHEVLAWSAVAIVALHIAGVVAHLILRRENIVLSMFTGRKPGLSGAAIPSPRFGSAVAFLLLTALWTAALFGGYDAATRKLTVPLTGRTLTLGETENDSEKTAQSPSGEAGEHDDEEEGEEHE